MGRNTFDLEERTRTFASKIRQLVRQIPRRVETADDLVQLVRSSGSVGANYIEANEYLGSKDFVFRLKIARKEAKESRHWLLLIRSSVSDPALDGTLERLVQEAKELVLILSAMIRNCS